MKRAHWLWLSAVVVALDLLTKQWALSSLLPYRPVPLLPHFDLTLMFNPGAAFSFLSDQGGWQRWFFIVVSSLVTAGLLVWLLRLGPGERRVAVALSLIIGGAVGNLIDRIHYGHVVDFIDLYYIAGSCLPLFAPVIHEGVTRCHWPAFNIADSAISAGVVLMLFDAFAQGGGDRTDPTEPADSSRR